MNLGIAEVLTKAEAIEDEAQRAAYALKAFDPATKSLIKMAFDNRIKWQLPEGSPPFKKTDQLDQEYRLKNELRRFYIFMEGGKPDLKQVKREYLFIQLLESVTPADAELIINVKDKKWPYKRVTKEFINKTFPGLLTYGG